MTDTPTAPVAKPAEAPVSANPALVEFPTDPWGMTSDFRKAGMKAVGSIRGDKAKYDLFVQTMRIIVKHAAARFPRDQVDMKERLAALALEEEARNNSARVSAQPTPVPGE